MLVCVCLCEHFTFFDLEDKLYEKKETKNIC
jgi:hypothetical protein